MYRSDGAIPPISAVRLPQRLVVFDTEAYRAEVIDNVEAQSLRLGVAVFVELGKDQEVIKEDWYNFTSPLEIAEFIDFCTRKNKTLFVYAHNIKYDLQLSGLLTALIEKGFEASTFVIDDPPTFIKLRRNRSSVVMVDTFNYWQYSLKEMGQQLGHVKLDMPPEAATNEEWFTYCKRDVEVLLQYLLTFIRFLVDNDLCGLGLTLASQAFKSYRYRFMTHEIILHNRPEVLTLERAGYYGGRTDAFYIGHAPNQPYYKLDVNSMYPFVMSTETYPVEFVGYSEDLPVARLNQLLNDYYCLANVTLNTQTPLYPFVRGEKLIFPTGVFSTTLHHKELARALHDQEISSINRIAIYNRADIFSQYVSFFYGIKVKAEADKNPILRKMAKIFLNALYGKFGQREIVSKIYPNEGQSQYARFTGFSEALGHNVEVNYLGNVIEVRYKGGEAYYSSPVIAGAVTANSRVYLWGLVERAGRENCYYCDTDSLIVNLAGCARLDPLIDPSRLGALKVEGIENHLLIRSVKDYEYGAEVKVKGVPKSAVQLEADKWQYQQFRGGKTWVADGLPVGVEVYTRTKTRKHVYDKGVVLPDGRVIPLTLTGGIEGQR